MTKALHDMNIDIRHSLHTNHPPTHSPKSLSLTSSTGNVLTVSTDVGGGTPKSPLTISPGSDDIDSLSDSGFTPSPTPRSVHANLSNTYCDQQQHEKYGPGHIHKTDLINGFTPRNGYHLNPFKPNIPQHAYPPAADHPDHDHHFNLLPVALIYGFIRSCLATPSSRRLSNVSIEQMGDDFDRVSMYPSSTMDEDEHIMDEHSDMAHVLPSNITQLILLYFDDDKLSDEEGGNQSGSFVWTLPTLELLTATSIDSIPFQTGSFLWYLSVHPYGVDEEHAYYSNLYINLASSRETLFDPQQLRLHELVINARLYCVETKSCWSSIKVYRSDCDYHGWQKGALKVDEMCAHPRLTFIAYINILKVSRLKLAADDRSSNPLVLRPSGPISASKGDTELLYQYPLSIERKTRFLIKWRIDESLMKDLQSANEMKRFESEMCHNMWVLGCVPHGIKKDNESSVFKMFLKLCALPPSVSRIKVKFNILCVETKKHLKYIYHDFDYKHKYWQTDKLCKRSYLMFDDFTSMRFNAEIEIIEQYDLEMNEISSALWRRHMDRGTVQQLATPRNQKDSRLLIHGFLRQIAGSPGFQSYHLQHSGYGGHGQDAARGREHVARRGIGYEGIEKVVLLYYPGRSFTWNISSEQILKLSQLNNKQRFDSRLFVMGNLKWFLQVYPNGYRPEDEGYCSVYLILAYLPSILKEVTIHFGVYCPQTMSNFSTIHTFNHSRDGRGTRRMLSLKHLNTIFGAECRGPITFRCFVNVLRVRVKEKRIIYQYPLSLQSASKRTDPIRHCTFRWQIDREMMAKFRECHYGQRVESAVFNEMWNLSCFPNEHKHKNRANGTSNGNAHPEEEQSVVLGLRLCALPQNIGRVKVRYTIRCIDFEAVSDSDTTSNHGSHYVKAC